jgi:hypothetical protein
MLVGLRCEAWEFRIPSLELEVRFEGERVLKLVPYPGAAEEGRDVWMLRDPDAQYTCVHGDGSVYIHHADEPGR